MVANGPAFRMLSTTKPITANELLTKKMSEPPTLRKPFLNVRERMYLIHNKTTTSSRAVGTIGLRYCIGMYCELNDTDCFVWHVYGHPITWKGIMEPTLSSVDQSNIARRKAQWLHEKLGPATELMRETLVLATSEFDMENGAIVDGILEWAGVKEGEEREKWKQQRLRCASTFIVEEPGNKDSVRYWPPIEIMPARHPGHWSRQWETNYQGLTKEDEFGQMEPEK